MSVSLNLYTLLTKFEANVEFMSVHGELELKERFGGGFETIPERRRNLILETMGERRNPSLLL
jgi:hypothetical protein